MTFRGSLIVALFCWFAPAEYPQSAGLDPADLASAATSAIVTGGFGQISTTASASVQQQDYRHPNGF